MNTGYLCSGLKMLRLDKVLKYGYYQQDVQFLYVVCIGYYTVATVQSYCNHAFSHPYSQQVNTQLHDHIYIA